MACKDMKFQILQSRLIMIDTLNISMWCRCNFYDFLGQDAID